MFLSTPRNKLPPPPVRRETDTKDDDINGKLDPADLNQVTPSCFFACSDSFMRESQHGGPGRAEGTGF
ncbi:hypothetical protein D3C75_922740 [compost metagenome]